MAILKLKPCWKRFIRCKPFGTAFGASVAVLFVN